MWAVAFLTGEGKGTGGNTDSDKIPLLAAIQILRFSHIAHAYSSRCRPVLLTTWSTLSRPSFSLFSFFCEPSSSSPSSPSPSVTSVRPLDRFSTLGPRRRVSSSASGSKDRQHIRSLSLRQRVAYGHTLSTPHRTSSFIPSSPTSIKLDAQHLPAHLDTRTDLLLPHPITTMDAILREKEREDKLQSAKKKVCASSLCALAILQPCRTDLHPLFGPLFAPPSAAQVVPRPPAVQEQQGNGPIIAVQEELSRRRVLVVSLFVGSSPIPAERNRHRGPSGAKRGSRP